jgi:hypothetical protein
MRPHTALRLLRTRGVAAAALTAVALAGSAAPGAGSVVTVSRSCGPARQIAPGITYRRCTAKLSNLGSRQQVDMVIWKQGDPRIALAAQPLGTPGRGGAIPITTTSHWAAAGSHRGLAAALNGDFFTYTSSWWSAYPSGLLVHRGAVLGFGRGSDEQEAGYGPGGRVVIGTPRILAERLLVPGPASLTVGAWGGAAGHRDQVGVIARSGRYTPPAGYDAVALASNPFTHALTGTTQMRNVHGVDRLEPVIRFVLNDPALPNVTLRVPATFAAAPGGSVTIPSGGVGLVYRDIGTAATAFAAVAAEASPGVTFTQPDAAWADATEVMSGKPVVVTKGVAAVAKPENTTSDQWYAEQWRPAIATRTDGTAMMIVAGSPTGRSTSGSQFARLLVAFGARQALQFDNRSSTELYRPRPDNGTCDSAGACVTEYGWERDIPLVTTISSR